MASYQDGAGHFLTATSNTVHVTTKSLSPPAPPDLSGLEGKVFGPLDTMVLPYSDTANDFVWDFELVDTSANASFPSRAAGASSQSATLSTFSPQLSLSALTLVSGPYLLRMQAIQNGLASAWATAHITWVATVGFGTVRVFPNPLRADRGDSHVTFDQLTVNSTVKIFTVSGQQVRTLDAAVGKAVWDLTNEKGEKVVSGLYLYLATNTQGQKTRGKFAVIR